MYKKTVHDDKENKIVMASKKRSNKISDKLKLSIILAVLSVLLVSYLLILSIPYLSKTNIPVLILHAIIVIGLVYICMKIPEQKSGYRFLIACIAIIVMCLIVWISGEGKVFIAIDICIFLAAIFIFDLFVEIRELKLSSSDKRKSLDNKNIQHMEKLQSKTDFRIIMPDYLPEGFNEISLDSGSWFWSKKIKVIDLVCENNEDLSQMIWFKQSIEPIKWDNSPKKITSTCRKIENVRVDIDEEIPKPGKKVKAPGEELLEARWSHHNIFYSLRTMCISREEFIKIITSIINNKG